MQTQRIGGAMLAVAALGTILTMAHHPSGGHAAGLNAFVHGAMMFLLSAMAWGFVQFVIVRGPTRGLVSAGAVAFAISLLGHIGAATINGFAVPALASGPPVSHDLFRFAWHLNQALAGVGVVAGAAAYVLWSADLLLGGGRVQKTAGAAGAIIGATILVLMLGGLVRLDVAGAMVVYTLQALWAVIVGVMLALGHLGESGKATTSS